MRKFFLTNSEVEFLILNKALFHFGAAAMFMNTKLKWWLA